MRQVTVFSIVSEFRLDLLHFLKNGVKYCCNRFQRAIAFLPLSAGAGGGFIFYLINLSEPEKREEPPELGRLDRSAQLERNKIKILLR